jgi:transposase
MDIMLSFVHQVLCLEDLERRKESHDVQPKYSGVFSVCPQAKIVFDLFHLVQAFGKVIDDVRPEEYKKADASGRQILKGSRYLLLSNQKNLKDSQKIRLQEVLELNKRLSSVYVLKDYLKTIYQYHRRGWAKKTLNQWCQLAAEIEHTQVRRFIGRLRFFEYGILNHCNYAISTGRLEGVNNKIKVIKRKAYGFHDPAYCALKIKQALPGIYLPRFRDENPKRRIIISRFTVARPEDPAYACILATRGITGSPRSSRTTP